MGGEPRSQYGSHIARCNDGRAKAEEVGSVWTQLCLTGIQSFSKNELRQDVSAPRQPAMLCGKRVILLCLEEMSRGEKWRVRRTKMLGVYETRGRARDGGSPSSAPTLRWIARPALLLGPLTSSPFFQETRSFATITFSWFGVGPALHVEPSHRTPCRPEDQT